MNSESVGDIALPLAHGEVAADLPNLFGGKLLQTAADLLAPFQRKLSTDHCRAHPLPGLTAWWSTPRHGRHQLRTVLRSRPAAPPRGRYALPRLHRQPGYTIATIRPIGQTSAAGPCRSNIYSLDGLPVTVGRDSIDDNLDWFHT